MSLVEILEKFSKEFSSLGGPLKLKEFDDTIRFLISILKEIYRFDKNFEVLKRKHLMDQNLKIDHIMDFVLNQDESENEKQNIYLLLTINQKQMVTLFDRIQNNTEDPYDKFKNLFFLIESVDYVIESPLITQFEEQYNDDILIGNLIVDQNDPIYLYQKNHRKVNQYRQENEFRPRLDTIIIDENNFDFEQIERFSKYCNNIKQIEKILPSLNTTDEIMTVQKKKNSQKLFESQFQEQLQYYKFPEQPKEHTLEEQNYQCHLCFKQISKGIYFAFNNSRYCFYTGMWYCTDCIAIDKQPIPYLAMKNFDLTCYNVCKPAQIEIEYLMNMAILEIKYDDDLVQQNQILYDFLILKRQIHLIYDKICDVQLMHDLFEGYLNFTVKQNIFSLQNLYQLYNGILIKNIDKYLQYLYKHIDVCQKCQKRGKICQICKDSKKIFTYQLLDTLICDKCNSLYHKSCLENNLCIRCMLD